METSPFLSVHGPWHAVSLRQFLQITVTSFDVTFLLTLAVCAQHLEVYKLSFNIFVQPCACIDFN